eukprot:scaffold275023_cov23-Prasinocladus_malaysianus.AAC.1
MTGTHLESTKHGALVSGMVMMSSNTQQQYEMMLLIVAFSPSALTIARACMLFFQGPHISCKVVSNTPLAAKLLREQADHN